MRLLVIIVLIILLGIAGSIAGMFTLSDGRTTCIQKSTRFVDWVPFYEVWKIQIHWPVFEYDCRQEVEKLT